MINVRYLLCILFPVAMQAMRHSSSFKAPLQPIHIISEPVWVKTQGSKKPRLGDSETLFKLSPHVASTFGCIPSFLIDAGKTRQTAIPLNLDTKDLKEILHIYSLYTRKKSIISTKKDDPIGHNQLYALLRNQSIDHLQELISHIKYLKLNKEEELVTMCNSIAKEKLLPPTENIQRCCLDWVASNNPINTNRSKLYQRIKKRRLSGVIASKIIKRNKSIKKDSLF